MASYRVAAAGIIAFSLQGAIASPSAPDRASYRDTAQLTMCTCPRVNPLWTHLNAAGALLERPTPTQTGHITMDPVRKLPSGTSTATSFWDGATASGRAMSTITIASPYWPLGTKIKVTYRGRSATGVVWDFGPAEWAVAQHDPPAIIDLAEPMMKKLTGSRVNSVAVHFQVLKLGSGEVYRHSGVGHALATR